MIPFAIQLIVERPISGQIYAVFTVKNQQRDHAMARSQIYLKSLRDAFLACPIFNFQSGSSASS